ncbi:MAG: hypothetical protein WBR30_09345, partial [Candidatus Sulfotelmatobacter sp.]
MFGIPVIVPMRHGRAQTGGLRWKAVSKHVYKFLIIDLFGGLIMRTWLATAAFQGRRVVSG